MGKIIHLRALLCAFAIISAAISFLPAQTPPAPVKVQYSYDRYIDPVTGRSADDVVAAALAGNQELIALRKEAEAAEALIKQARLRANPSLEISGTRQIRGADNSFMVEGAVPLELWGRRPARIRVAEAEAEIRRLAVLERERQLAFEVRAKFGEALAAGLKLKFSEDTLAMAQENYALVSAQVTEGRRPPLEQNQELVELNRMRAEREMAEAAAEALMFELRNLMGLRPEEPLKLKNDIEKLLKDVPPQTTAGELALQARPDLQGARAVETLAAARIDQAKAEGRIDAEAMIGYQRMRSGFPFLGTEEATGMLMPIDNRFHFFTFGIRLNLPIMNRNQGMVAAARIEADAARSRREFGEVTVRREIAAAYARYVRTVRTMEIYRVGIRDQAAANAEVVRQTYELGSKTLLDYIAEHHRYVEIEKTYIDAVLEAYLARLEVLRAVNASELVNK